MAPRSEDRLKCSAKICVLWAAVCLAAGARADTVYVDGVVTQDLADSGATAVHDVV